MKYTWEEIDAMIGDAATHQNAVLLGDGRNMEALAGMLCGDITNLAEALDQFRPGRKSREKTTKVATPAD